MNFLHTMLRVGDMQRSVDFYTRVLGMRVLRQRDVPEYQYSLTFLGFGAGNEDGGAELELTYNYGVSSYDLGTAFGHLALGVPDVAAACQRIRDRYPAGTVTLRGAYFTTHRDDILNLARNVEESEKGEHPMNRIMGIEEQDGATVVSTTDMHLARAIGSAVHAAHKGEIDWAYDDEEARVRVTWERA